MAATGSQSDPSTAAVADGDLLVFDDDRDLAAALRVLQHPLEAGLVLLDIHVFERYVPPGKIITGGLGVRSRVLPEDVDHLSPP